jgi:hypothetical protein
MLPLTPSCYGVAIDSRDLEFTALNTSELDEAKLTNAQIETCMDCIYAERDLNDEEWFGFVSILDKRPKRPPIQDDPKLWEMNLFIPPNGRGFDFVKLH